MTDDEQYKPFSPPTYPRPKNKKQKGIAVNEAIDYGRVAPTPATFGNAAQGASVERHAAGLEQKQATRRRKPPPQIAIQAYKLVRLIGMKQKDAAEEMSKEHKRKIGQEQVSRWVKQVEKFYESNGLPVESGKSKPNIITTDPSVLAMGTRKDGKITGDPRHKRR